MDAEALYGDFFRQERSLDAVIPYSNHLSETDLITKEGDLLRIYNAKGISFETTDVEELIRRKEQLNNLFRGIGTPNVAIWIHHVRRRRSDRLYSHYENMFCREFDGKYYDSFKKYRMLANELYITIVYRPVPSSVGKAFAKAGKRSLEQVKREHVKSMSKLNDICIQIESSLKDYGLSSLGMETIEAPGDPQADEEGFVFYSDALTFLNYLISGVWQKVRVPNILLSEYLGTASIRSGPSTIEINNGMSKRYAKAIDFKEYASGTSAGVFDELMYLDFEYVITQSFSFMLKRDSMEFLKKQKGQLENTNDGSVSQIVEMDLAIDQLTNGDFSMGEYHFTMLVFGETPERTQENTTDVIATLQGAGYLAAVVNLATDAAFFSQLPCNWEDRPRIAKLTSQNYAGMTSLHNFVSGKRDGNPWGDAVTILKTPSGQPVYFNFHQSEIGKNDFGKMRLGNTTIIGRAGSGKTALVNALLAQAQKYAYKSEFGFSTVFFDKDEGAKVSVNALGGKYLSLKNGVPTGFNPFQMEITPNNTVFLNKLLKWMVKQDGNKLSTSDETKIEIAINTVLSFPLEMRRFSTLVQNLTEDTMDLEARENSIVKRLAKWCLEDANGKRGKYAWVFDNDQDELDFNSHRNIGIDGTDFLDNDDICTPITMYLLHRMDDVIDGRRFIYVMDELWKWLATDGESGGGEFSEFVGDKQLTIRKMNGLGIFASQMPSSLLKSKVANQLVQQSATKIFLPNPNADPDEYMKGFGLSETEFSIVRDLGDGSRLMLIKQGHNSMLAGLDLTGFDDELLIFSGSSDTNQIFDEVISEVGSDPQKWIPQYIHRCNNLNKLEESVGS